MQRIFYQEVETCAEEYSLAGVIWKGQSRTIEGAEELAKQHTAEPYGPRRHIFSVRGKGDTSLGDERYGGRNYRVDLEKVE